MPGGELTWVEFLQKANDFIKLSDILNDSWCLIKVNNDPAGSYLRYKQYQKIRLADGDEEIYTFEYHVVYSISYCVPVFYFKIQNTAGKLVWLDEFVEIFLQRLELKENEVDLKTAITQMEHPVLFSPFLAIHPCRTSEVLSKTPNSRNKLLTFISALGPMILLKLDMMYGKELE